MHVYIVHLPSQHTNTTCTCICPITHLSNNNDNTTKKAVFASATGAAPDVRGLAGSIMEEGFVTIDSQYQDKEREAEAEEGEGAVDGGAAAEGAAEGEGVRESEGLDIELPASLRHGIFITPPAKLEDGLRRCVVVGYAMDLDLLRPFLPIRLIYKRPLYTNHPINICSFLNTEPAPERVMVFANDALKVRN